MNIDFSLISLSILHLINSKKRYYAKVCLLIM